MGNNNYYLKSCLQLIKITIFNSFYIISLIHIIIILFLMVMN